MEESNTKTLTTRQTNKFIHAKVSKIKPTVYKLFLASAALHKQNTFPKVWVNQKVLREALDISPNDKSYFGKIKQSAHDLRSWNIEISDEFGNYEVLGVVDQVNINSSSGEIEITFAEHMRHHISLLNSAKNKYAPIELHYCRKLSTTTAMKLYSLLHSHYWQREKVKTKLFSLTKELEIRKGNDPCEDILYIGDQLGFSGKSYQNFGNLKQRKIDPAVNDINNNSDVRIIEVNPIKKGRKTSFIEFKFQTQVRKPESVFIPKNVKTEYECMQEILIQRLLFHGFETELAHKFMDSHGAENIGGMLFKLESQLKSGVNIKNPAGWLVSYTQKFNELEVY